MKPETDPYEKRAAIGKGLLWALGALVLLLLLVWIVPMNIQKIMVGKKIQPLELEPVLAVALENITGCEVRSARDYVALTRTAEGWYLTQPTDAKANPVAVNAFLNSLCTWIPERPAPGPLPPLADEALQYTLHCAGQPDLSIRVRSYEPEPQYLLVQRQDSTQGWILRKKPELDLAGLGERLRDRHIFEEPLLDISRISFRDKESVVTLEKNRPTVQTKVLSGFGSLQQLTVTAEVVDADSAWAVVYPRKGPANQKTVESILDLIQQLEAVNFVQDSVGIRSTLAAYGLIKPQMEVTLFPEQQRYPVSIAFGLPETENRVYLKTSLSSKIVEIKEERLIVLQELFSHVVSQKLVYFLDQIARMEISTDKWIITVARQGELWEAVLQKKTASVKELGPRTLRVPEENALFFEGEIMVQAIENSEYLDCVTPGNPFYKELLNAKSVMKIFFLRDNGIVYDVYTVLKSKHLDEVVFVKKQTDQEVYSVVGTLYSDLLKEIEFQLANLEKKGPPQ